VSTTTTRGIFIGPLGGDHCIVIGNSIDLLNGVSTFAVETPSVSAPIRTVYALNALGGHGTSLNPDTFPINGSPVYNWGLGTGQPNSPG
jgi:hypothetical protein